eukprot:1586027-Prymnesium_polylepis.1
MIRGRVSPKGPKACCHFAHFRTWRTGVDITRRVNPHVLKDSNAVVIVGQESECAPQTGDVKESLRRLEGLTPGLALLF